MTPKLSKENLWLIQTTSDEPVTVYAGASSHSEGLETEVPGNSWISQKQAFEDFSK